MKIETPQRLCHLPLVLDVLRRSALYRCINVFTRMEARLLHSLPFFRLAALPLIVIMCVAIWTAQHDFISSAKSWSDLFALSEFLYIALLTWLAVYGGGLLSVDRLLGKLCGKQCAAKPEAK